MTPSLQDSTRTLATLRLREQRFCACEFPRKNFLDFTFTDEVAASGAVSELAHSSVWA
jgi:hypothetical protein